MISMNEADHAVGPGEAPSPGPDPYGDPGPTPPTPPRPPTPRPEMRRLYREPEDKRIAGVCSGVADYLGVDPTVVRLVAVLLAFMTGVMVLVYLIAAFVVPLRPESRGRAG